MNKKTNELCINSLLGVDCIALREIDPGCRRGECPWYKTTFRFKATEASARSRCVKRGIPFKSRDEIIKEMQEASEREAKKYAKRKQAKKVIRSNAAGTVSIEYGSPEAAAKAAGISPEMLQEIIKDGSAYQGSYYRYV